VFDLDRHEGSVAYSDTDDEMLVGVDTSEDGCEIRRCADGESSREDCILDAAKFGPCTRC
jgi:hypothetical protein